MSIISYIKIIRLVQVMAMLLLNKSDYEKILNLEIPLNENKKDLESRIINKSDTQLYDSEKVDDSINKLIYKINTLNYKNTIKRDESKDN